MSLCSLIEAFVEVFFILLVLYFSTHTVVVLDVQRVAANGKTLQKM